ncbi:hypothetical protein LXL04_039114 [Taraxacum kok-saghyz]
MDFEIGTSVEVIQTEEGLQGSYFAGLVIDRTPGMRKIKYATLQDDNGNPLEELISFRRMRPPPPKSMPGITMGGGLGDTFVEGDNYIVVFDNTPDEEFLYARRHIRFHHECSAVRDRNDQTANQFTCIG